MKNLLGALTLLAIGTATVAFGATPKAEAASLINGGFEDPVVPSDVKWTLFDEGLVPGWEAAGGDTLIEIHSNRLLHSGALDTNQYAELNGASTATLYQDVVTTAGSTMHWRFFHRGRNGVDTMRLSLIDLDSNATLFSQLYSTDRTDWVEYTGTTVAAGSNTRWVFESVSVAGGTWAMGNFIDEVYFSETPIPGSKSVPEPSAMVGLTLLGAGFLAKKKMAKA